MSISLSNFHKVGIVGCFIGIISGVCALAFAYGVSNITAYELQMGEGIMPWLGQSC